MPTKIIRDPLHIVALSRLLSERKLPLTVSWSQGASQVEGQNRLAQRWFTDVSRQRGDMTREEVRADAKVTFGVPILCAENDAFRAGWQATFAAFDYEAVRKHVAALDVPVTRLMTLKQMTAFMEAFSRFWRRHGFYLTDPEALKYETEFGPMEGAA